jgi:hypothetical protein
LIIKWQQASSSLFNKPVDENVKYLPIFQLLLEEEKEQEVGSTGPCLEYLLQHHLLDLLATLACTDCPPGMKQHTLGFVRRLITQTKQPILPHIGIYVGIQVSIKYAFKLQSYF